MEITELKVLHMTNPLGIGVTPYFSWKLRSEQPGTVQTQYQLTVTNPDGRTVMETGPVVTDKNTYIAYAGEPLHSRNRYTVEVSVQDNHGNTAKQSGWFETALLAADEWAAQWIAPQKKAKPSKPGFGNGRPATLFRQTFSVDGEVVSARLYATCHGAYEVYLNGKAPDTRIFAPEHTVYEKYLCYQTYDILPLLCAGSNAIGMVVGDGWYHCPNAKPNMKTDAQHAALYQMELVYRDGRREVIGSDETALVSDGAVRSADLYAGEQYDARREQPGWACADFDASQWEHAVTKKCRTARFLPPNAAQRCFCRITAMRPMFPAGKLWQTAAICCNMYLNTQRNCRWIPSASCSTVTVRAVLWRPARRFGTATTVTIRCAGRC